MKPATAMSCRCGQVRFEIIGSPEVATACYCDDCQAGSRQLEALGTPPTAGPDGGTPYLLYRKDRVSCVAGAERLAAHKLRPHSISNRVVATCCDTPMLVGFDRGPHWVSVYRDRFGSDAPPLTARVQTKFAPGPLPGDLPEHAGYPAGMLIRLVLARIAMAFGR